MKNKKSELKFKDLAESKFGGFVKVIWNWDIIYDDADEGLYIDHKLAKISQDHPMEKVWQEFMEKYGSKEVYNINIRVVDFHHTEVFIEGEK